MAASIMGAGSGTPAHWIQFLVLIMVAHPEVQKKAHEEIDLVIGTDRMPTLQDLNNLPYIQAIINEVLLEAHENLSVCSHCSLQVHRFRTLVPLSVPHRAIADVVVRLFYLSQSNDSRSIKYISVQGLCNTQGCADLPKRLGCVA